MAFFAMWFALLTGCAGRTLSMDVTRFSVADAQRGRITVASLDYSKAENDLASRATKEHIEHHLARLGYSVLPFGQRPVDSVALYDYAMDVNPEGGFVRSFVFDIYRVTTPDAAAELVFQGTLTSTGATEDVESLLSYFVDAIFKPFPGVNGKPERVTVTVKD
jgi:hypothetical protein